jgi:trypsin
MRSILPIAALLLASLSCSTTYANPFSNENVGLRGRDHKHKQGGGQSLHTENTPDEKDKPQEQGASRSATADPEEERIIGGAEATPNKNKFVASLQDKMGHFCGGSLITRNVVLTAAHCQGAPFDVVLGRHDLDRSDGQVIGITKQVPHPKYNDRTTDNDYMLVYLKSPATLNGDVATVKLNDDSSTPSVGNGVTVMGWGDTDIRDDVSKLSDVLMKVQVKVISNSACDASKGNVGGYSDSYKGQITQNMLCAKANRQDSCQGDSGGPLVTGNGVQVGVVSWGISCAHDAFPGVYARVSQAYDWIEGEVCRGNNYATEAGFKCSGSVTVSGSEPNPSPSKPSGSGGGSKPNPAPSKPNPAPSPSGGGGGKCSKYSNKWDCKRDSACRWKKGRCVNKR